MYLTTGAVDAKGIITVDGFLLFAGSKTNENTSEKSLTLGMVKLRKKHFDAGCVENLVTVEDILFSSSSAATDFVTGYSVSGPRTWKNKQGKTLKEIEAEKLDMTKE